MPFVCAWPRTYSPTLCRTASWRGRSRVHRGLVRVDHRAFLYAALHEPLKRRLFGTETTSALTRPVARSLMPATGTLPPVPLPTPRRLERCLFFSLPPTNVSSASTARRRIPACSPKPCGYGAPDARPSFA